MRTKTIYVILFNIGILIKIAVDNCLSFVLFYPSIDRWEDLQKIPVFTIENQSSQFYSNPNDDNYYKLINLLNLSVSFNEECPSNLKQCGLLDTMDHRMCIDKDKECPINLMIRKKTNEPPVEYPYEFQNISLNDSSYLFYTNEATDNHIVATFTITDGKILNYLDEENKFKYTLLYYRTFIGFDKDCLSKYYNHPKRTDYEYYIQSEKDTVYQSGYVLNIVLSAIYFLIAFHFSYSYKKDKLRGERFLECFFYSVFIITVIMGYFAFLFTYLFTFDELSNIIEYPTCTNDSQINYMIDKMYQRFTFYKCLLISSIVVSVSSTTSCNKPLAIVTGPPCKVAII